MSDDSELPDAGDRLIDDIAALTTAVLRLRDSITGAWGSEGRPYIPQVAGAASGVINSLGRLANVIEKAAHDIDRRAGDAYIDRLGEHANATVEVRGMTVELLEVSAQLQALYQRSYPLMSRLGGIGERVDD